jgi:hypothetical protein
MKWNKGSKWPFLSLSGRLLAMPGAVARAFGFLIVGIVAAVGPFLLALGAFSVVRTEMFIHSSIAVDGKIVDMRQMRGRRGAIFAPVFRFNLQDGQVYVVGSNTGTNPPQFKIGDRVKVLYRPGHPEGARIDSFGQLFLFPLAAGIVGGSLTVLTVLIFRRAQKQRALLRT